jgi:hypothetical protein
MGRKRRREEEREGLPSGQDPNDLIDIRVFLICGGIE